MKKKFLFAALSVLCMLAVLTACNKADDSDGLLDAVVQSEIPEEPVVLNISDFLNKDGFVSAEAAYSTKRADWHEMLGEPAISSVTYDGNYIAECYLYISDDESWGQFLEFDYDIDALGGLSDSESDDESSGDDVEDGADDESDDSSEDQDLPVFTSGASPADAALPKQIRYVPFASDDGDVVMTAIDLESVMSVSTLAINKHFFMKPVSTLIDRLGEPNNSDLTAWGYASWDADPIRFIAYLDNDMNILYSHRVPLWDEDDTVDAESSENEQDSEDSSESDSE